MTVYLLGATGFTGRLLLPQLLFRGLKPIAVGRNAESLEDLKREFPAVDIAIANTLDEASLKELIAPGDLVISTVGPFMELGVLPLKVAVENMAHYMDCTGEPNFIEHVYQQYENQLKDSQQLIMTACGYDYVPGLFLAESLMKAAGDEKVDTLNIAYSTPEGRIASMSSGTLTSLVKALYEQGMFYNNGIWNKGYLCNRSWKIDIKGKKVRCVSLAGLECCELPRNHSSLKNVNTYLGWFGSLSILAQGFSIAQQKLFAIPGFLKAMQSLVKRVSFPRRKTSSVMSSVNSDVYLYAEAVDAQGRILVSGELEGHNMYQYTVDIMAWMALQIAEQNIAQYGVIGPVRAFGLDELGVGHRDIGMRLKLKPYSSC